MMALWELVIGPFAEFAFMRRALVATLALAVSAAPLGIFLTLRRMSLLGDAISHAVLPGVAVGFMFSGLSLAAMATGGVISGMLAAALAGLISRFTTLKEDASLAAIYLMALATGAPIDVSLVLSALSTAMTAAGGWTWIQNATEKKPIAAPPVSGN